MTFFMGRSLKPLQMISLCGALTILGACQQSEQDPVMGAQPTVSGPARNALESSQPVNVELTSTNMGTADPGGGNGAEGRVLESYITPLDQMRGFNAYLKPVFERWTKEDLKVLFALPNAKLWYVAPLTLKPIDKSALGFSFTKDGLQQLAIQTQEAIVIDEKMMAKSDDRAFAELVWHEIVMSWYLLKFDTMNSFCARLEAKQAIEGRCGKSDKIMGDLLLFNRGQARASHRLEAEDYERIRRVTHWILERGATASGPELIQVLIANRFDFFTMTAQKPVDVIGETVRADEIYRALRMAPELGDAVKTCVYGDRKSEVCKFQIEVASPKGEALGYRFRIQRPDGEQTDLGYLSSEVNLATMTLGPYTMLRACLSKDISNLKVEDVGQQICFSFRPTENFANKALDFTERVHFAGIEVLRFVVAKVTEENQDFEIRTAFGTSKNLRCLDMRVAPGSDPRKAPYVLAVQDDFVVPLLARLAMTEAFGGGQFCQPK